MNKVQRVYRNGFCNKTFVIECGSDAAYAMADFLFRDFPGGADTQATVYYRIQDGSDAGFVLREGEKELYAGSSRYQLAYTLMNEVIFHCIHDNSHQHALHAGAVRRNKHCILLPGKSGNGKSTLTCWLLQHGFHYLTDELVFLGADSSITPLTRPISLKVGPGHASWPFEEHHEDIITSETGSMIPHRLLNPEYAPIRAKVTHIIYPQFVHHGKPALQEISPAQSSLFLLRSHVNARNLQGHGVKNMTAIVRGCRSFTLTYGKFGDLPQFFNCASGAFA